MDVTSQLNLEREAGMGENTERQPMEPLVRAAAAALAEPRPKRAKGVRANPGGGQAAAFFLHCPASSLAILPAAHVGSCPAPPAPSNTRSFSSLRKTTHPKTTNQRQQINQIESPNVLDQCSGSLSERRLTMEHYYFFLLSTRRGGGDLRQQQITPKTR